MPSLIADSAIAKDLQVGGAVVNSRQYVAGKSTIRFANSWQAAMTAHEAVPLGLTECTDCVRNAGCALNRGWDPGAHTILLCLAVHRNGTGACGNLFALVFAHAGTCYIDSSLSYALRLVIPT